MRAKLSYFANCYVSGYRPSRNVQRKHGILKTLGRNKDIVILKPDKGNGVVILNHKDYIESILKIVSDDGDKFKTLSEDPTTKREGQLQRFFRKFKKDFY